MKKFFKLLGALLTFKLGAIAALLFAQRSGKSLRKDLSKSENPFKTLFDEGMKIDKEILNNVQDWAKNSESVKEMMQQVDSVKSQAKDLTDEAKAEMQKNLEKIAADAQAAAEDLKKQAHKKVTSAKKTATKKASTAKKKAVKTMKKKATKTKKTMAKKANTARKTATKTLKDATSKK